MRVASNLERSSIGIEISDEYCKLTALDDVFKRKNPYLFKAKGNNSAHDFIQSVLDATVSSGEETAFGNFLENIAIFVCEKVYGGRKSGITGIDLEFEDSDKNILSVLKVAPTGATRAKLIIWSGISVAQ